MYRSGFVAIIGRPSVGKSTLLNRLAGQKIAITSQVPQTTRHRIKGVVHTEKGQAILMDTPGFSKPLDQLGLLMTEEGLAGISEADLIAFVVDASVPPGAGDEWLAQKIRETGKPVFLLLNKIDVLKQSPDRLAGLAISYRKLFQDYGSVQCIRISAKTGKNTSSIVDSLIRKLPEGPALFDADAVTDQRIREIAAEIIREKVLYNTRDEIPHSVAVGIETFDESSPTLTRIEATLYVDQASQKSILIGKGGEMIKSIGSAARLEIQELIEKKVFLSLNVKIRLNWRKDKQFLKSLGMALPTR